MASQGNYSVDLNGHEPGSISQSFNTIPGDTYCVKFDLAGNPNGTPSIKIMKVDVGGTTIEFNFDISGNSALNMGWEEKLFNFTAIATQSKLKFTSLIQGSAGASIDNVQVSSCFFDCAGTLNGTAILDDCGMCLEPTDPAFNQCLDCAGTPNGTAILDDCGVCLEPNDPAYNQCLDCAGTPNGTAILDDCGVCLEPTDPAFNQCLDCAGMPNGTAMLDTCGVCLEPTDPAFNQCLDCAGTPSGTAIMDDCGVCLEPTDPAFQQCLDCAGNTNGTAIMDDCGVGLEPARPAFNHALTVRERKWHAKLDFAVSACTP